METNPPDCLHAAADMDLILWLTGWTKEIIYVT
jgi:hypothetical protein